ncbi:MAG: GNAT family N-acetyltransferase [Flavobacteriaceae bacterium]
MSAIAVRRTTTADAGVIAALHAACFSTPWDAASVLATLSGGGAEGFLATGGGAAVGFAIARFAAGEAEILSIGVEPAARRHGIATQLLAAVVARAGELGVSALFIEVAEADSGAVSFYREAGFEPCGRRRGYYPDRAPGHSDALVMKRDVATSGASAELDPPGRKLL